MKCINCQLILGWIVFIMPRNGGEMLRLIGAILIAVTAGGALAQTALVPQMTSDTAPSGVASSSTAGGYGVCGAQLSWNAFDRSGATEWVADVHATGWLQYGFTAAQTVATYSLMGWGSCGPSTSARAPKSWQLICQDTGAVLDTRANISFTQNVAQNFSIASPVSCLAYRLNITANNGDASYVQVMDLQLYDGLPPKTLACEGDSQTAIRTGVTDSQTWCALLAAKLGWNHVNFAVPGSTSQDVINRLPTDLLTKADCWVVQIGANDSFITSGSASYPPEWTAPQPGVISLAQFKTNLAAIKSMIGGSTGAPPLTLMSQWPFFSTIDLVQEQFYVDGMKDVGAQLSIPVVDAWSMGITGLWQNYQNNLSAFAVNYELDYQHGTAAAHGKEAALFAQDRYKASCAYHP